MRADAAPFIEHVGCEIGAVRPHDRPGVTVDSDGSEELGIGPDALEHRTAEVRLEVDDAFRAVIEPKANDVILDELDSGDVHDPPS